MKRFVTTAIGCLVITSILLLQFAGSQQPKKPRWKPSPHIAPTEAKSPAEQRKTMRVPPGFDLQLVAAEPDIKNPMNIAFDAKGRLWVTMSSEYPFPSNKRKTKDTVKILEDFGPDGRARKITTFADNLNIPIGVLPLDSGNAAIVFSIPNIWLLEDTDGDGKADRKKILLQKIGQRDTHGLTGEFQWGFDGWIYACHGFSNTSIVQGTDGSKIQMQSGNTYRFKPDGTRVNYHTHGQVNPFGLAFDPMGNLFSCDCHSQPVYQLLRGAWYPSFAKPHDGLGFGPPMMTNHHGSTAIAGIAYYADKVFPKGFHDNLFIGNVVTNRVNRDSLIRFGSTYRAKKQKDLVASTDRWFRPVDIKLGPDGAIYICDFYNRIIGHYEVPLTHPGRDRDHGRIWRVVYKGRNAETNARNLKRDWTTAGVGELVNALADPNLTVRMTAMRQLVLRGGEKGINGAKDVLRKSNDVYQQIHALWVLAQQNKLDDDLLFAAAQAKSSKLRVHAMRVLADQGRCTSKQYALALELLGDSDAFVQRQAAQVLAVHRNIDSLSPMLQLRKRIPKTDTHLLHVVRMAIRDQFKSDNVWEELKKRKWPAEDIRLLADGMLSLQDQNTMRFLTTNINLLPIRRSDYVRHVARFGDKKTRSRLYDSLKNAIYAKDSAGQAAMIKAVHQGASERGGQMDKAVISWAEALTQTIFREDRGKLPAAIEIAGLLRLRSTEKSLQEFLQDRKASAILRSRSAEALARIDSKKHLSLLGKILESSAEPLALRRSTATALAAINLPIARKKLIESLATASAALQLHIAIDLAGSRAGADRLLTAVEKGKASGRLLQNREVQVRVRRSDPPRWKQRLAKLTKGLPSFDARLLALLRKRSAGFAKAKTDLALGRKIFEKNCAACHKIGEKGGKLAPQLDGVGVRGPDRLLEDILDPNRNVDQEFRASTLVLKSGQLFNGLFIRQDGNVFVMADGKGQEKRFNKTEVVRRFVSPSSPMPANWGEQIAPAEMYHLLAFLLSQRQKAESEKR